MPDAVLMPQHICGLQGKLENEQYSYAESDQVSGIGKSE